MPKAKNKKNPVVEDDSGDEGNHTQSMTQAERVMSSISIDDSSRKVNELVQFLLIMDQKKQPIKRIDINKIVLKETSKAFPAMMEKAKAKLKDVFGIDLREIDGKGTKSYILVNRHETESDSPHLQWSPADNARMGLLMVVLSMVFMKENVVTDGELYHFLRKLDVDVEKNHNQFGDVKKLLTKEFVWQKYLEYTVVPNTEPQLHEFRWGQRAKAEITKRNVLDVVCQIYQVDGAHVWTAQYNDMCRSEGQPVPAPGAAPGASQQPTASQKTR